MGIINVLWKGLNNVENTADATKNVRSAQFPVGFNSMNSSPTWGIQNGTVVTDWHENGGGDIQFRTSNFQLLVLTDGYFYQNEGRYRCLDENNFSNYAATKAHNHNTSITDWNTATTSGFYISTAGASNVPVSDVGITGYVSATGKIIVQTVYPENTSVTELTSYIRKGIKNSSSSISWTYWEKNSIAYKTTVLKGYNGSSNLFDDLTPYEAVEIVFTDKVMPSDATLIDVDADGDSGVVAWLDTSYNILYVSTQKEGVKVQCAPNSTQMFFNHFNLKSIDFSNLDTSTAIIMASMFQANPFLETLDVSNWDTSNVTNMNGMFASLIKVSTLNVSKWNTSNVTDMCSMFSSMTVSKFDLSNWDTSNVTNMSSMFAYGGAMQITVGNKFKWICTLSDLGLNGTWQDETGTQYTSTDTFPSNVAHTYSRVS